MVFHEVSWCRGVVVHAGRGGEARGSGVPTLHAVTTHTLLKPHLPPAFLFPLTMPSSGVPLPTIRPPEAWANFLLCQLIPYSYPVHTLFMPTRLAPLNPPAQLWLGSLTPPTPGAGGTFIPSSLAVPTRTLSIHYPILLIPTHLTSLPVPLLAQVWGSKSYSYNIKSVGDLPNSACSNSTHCTGSLGPLPALDELVRAQHRMVSP